MAMTSMAERSLFADLTGIFMRMKDEPYAAVEAAIEERFRAFALRHAGQPVAGLQITLTWKLPDGPGEWAEYGMEYRTVPAEAGDGNERPSAPPPGAREAEIIAFPLL
jgi:hypothetical protein